MMLNEHPDREQENLETAIESQETSSSTDLASGPVANADTEPENDSPVPAKGQVSVSAETEEVTSSNPEPENDSPAPAEGEVPVSAETEEVATADAEPESDSPAPAREEAAVSAETEEPASPDLEAGEQPAGTKEATPEHHEERNTNHEDGARDEDFVSAFDESDEEFVPPTAPDGHEDLLAKIDAFLQAHEPGSMLLTDTTIPDLIQLINWMAFDNAHLNDHVGRVNLIRNAFDALKAADSLDHHMEQDFRGAFATFNRQRSRQQQGSMSIRVENARKKRDLIRRLRDLVENKNPDLISDVRVLQDEWKTIGQVPNQDLETLYKEYRGLLDEFYALRSVHLELMEYDRKKNLEEKGRLLEVARNLIPAEADKENAEVWKEKLDLLNELQQEWKAAGHVPREDMERINEEYRKAIDAFFEARQAYREVEDQQREANATVKLLMLGQLEAFRDFQGDSPRKWNDATQVIREVQEAWNKVGPAPSKQNSELWGRFRDLCNTFFAQKSAFFKQLDEERNHNLQLKQTLLERVEAMKTRSDWEAAARDLKVIQQEWKSIGPVPDRHSQKLWNRFRAACDAFFEGRRDHYAVLHAEEKDNLTIKKALIEEVKALSQSEMGRTELIEAVKQLQARWKDSGRVPFKEKEKVWKEFRTEIDKIFEGLDNRRTEVRREKVVARVDTIEDGDERVRAIRGNIMRLKKRIQAAQEKVDQYSTNIQFISKGKSGDSLRTQIQAEIDRELAFIKEQKKEIKDLETLLNAPKEVAPEPVVVAAAPVPAAEDASESETEPETETVAEAETPSEPETAEESETKSESETEA